MKHYLKKKGLSPIIATVLLVALVVAAGAMIWVVVNNIITSQLDQSGTCFGVLNQVTINNDYTCYNSTAKKLQFSINVGDINLSGVYVAVSFGGGAKSGVLTSTPLEAGSDITTYPNGEAGAKMPNRNSGSTYFFSGITLPPLSVSVAPIVSGRQCDAADTLDAIDDCSALVNH